MTKKRTKGGSVTWSERVVAALDAVAEELDKRGSEDLSEAVDDASESISAPSRDVMITPDQRENAPMHEMFDWTGFDGNVLTRDDDVADEIYEERIPTQDPYEGVY